MKKVYILVIIIQCCITLLSCHEDLQSTTMAEMETSNGLKVNFERTEIRINGKDTIELNFEDQRNNNGYASLSLLFTNCPLQLGRHRILPIIAGNKTTIQSHLYLIDIDAIVDTYEISAIDSVNSFLEFTEIDIASGHLKGTYRCTYLRDTLRPKYYINIPNELKIINGSFDINQKW